MRVYLSSTLDDLRDERRLAREALVEAGCAVQESYLADERSLRDSINDDIAGCDVYILILGLRYGFVPRTAGNDLSITELEYVQAKAAGLARLVFIKDPAGIPAVRTDAYTGEHPPNRIQQFRDRFASGSEDEPRGAQFTDADNLKYQVAQAIARRRQQSRDEESMFSGLVKHPRRINTDMCICTLPGTDDDLGLPAAIDSRAAVVALGLQPEDDYLSRLDRLVRSSRSLFFVLRPQSLSRLRSSETTFVDALRVVKARVPLFAVLIDVPRDALPAGWAELFNDLFDSAAAEWAAANRADTLLRLTRWRRERVPDTVDAARIGVPYLAIALTDEQANEMHTSPDAVFARFADPDLATSRRRAFDELRNSLTAAGLAWPDGFYQKNRNDWRPFGPATAKIEEFIADAARKVNTAGPGSRERRLLLQAQILPQRYLFEEYLNDTARSAANLHAVCEEGCLVVVDEFALLHPALVGKIEALLSSNNAAVVSISACDPSYRSLQNLLSGTSYLRVGNLLSRFSQSEDVRCEVAVNSVARLQRWLRFVLPELLLTLGQQQSNPELVSRVDVLLPTSR